MINDIKEKASARYSYAAFVELTDHLLADNKTTGTNHSEAYLDYTRINQQRNHRIYKTTEINPELTAAIAALKGNYHWLVLVEAWCGDVAQNLPVIAKAAEGHSQIHLEVTLRDENLDLMDQYLTDGGRAIPKLIVTDLAKGKVVAHWGPRPAPAQALVMAYKARAVKEPYQEFVKTVQLWYAHDHTRTLQAELLQLVQTLEKPPIA
jgi:hypothetical protein